MDSNLLIQIRRIAKYLSVVLLFLTGAFFIVVGYWGLASTALTLVVYTILWITGRFLIKIFVQDSGRQKNYILFLSALILSLFAAELTLKYILQTDDLREEEFGFVPYPCGGAPFVENLFYRYYRHQTDLRLRNSEPGSSINGKQEEFEYPIRYNSTGFRGSNFSEDTNLYNLVGLGDSFTESIGAPEDSTWLNLLTQKLNESAIIPKRIQSVNGGMHGSDPFFEYIILKELLLKYDPKLVLLTVNKTDIYDIIKNGGWERFSNDHELQSRPRPWWYMLYQSSAIARYIVHINRNWLLLTPAEYLVEENAAIEKIVKCITDDYLPLSKKSNFKLIVILHPMLDELERSDFVLQKADQSLKNLNDIATINLYEEYTKVIGAQKTDYKSYYWINDGHHNGRGYNLWAEILSEKLTKLLSFAR